MLYDTDVVMRTVTVGGIADRPVKHVRDRRTGSRLVFATAAILVTVAAFSYRYLSFSHFSNDHFLHLSLGQQITRGELPVRDFVERGFPLMSMLSAWAQIAFGHGLHSELLLIGAAFAAATLLSFIAAIRVSGSLSIALITSLMTLLVFPATYGYPKVLAYAACFTAAAWYCARPGWFRLGILSASVVVAFLLRHDHGALLAPGVALLLATRHGFGRNAIAPLVRFSVLTTLLALPYLSWVGMHDDVRRYFVDGFAFSWREAQRSVWWTPPRLGLEAGLPLFEAGGPAPTVNVRWSSELSDAAVLAGEARHGLRRLAEAGARSWQYAVQTWAPDDLRALLEDPAVADTHGIDRSTYRLTVPPPEGLTASLHRYRPGEGLRLRPNTVAILFYTVWVVPLLALAVVAFSWTRTPAPVLALVLMAVAVQYPMNLSMLRDPLDSRIRDVIMPLSLLLAFIAATLFRGGRGMLARVLLSAAGVLVLAVPLSATAIVGQLSGHLTDMSIARGPKGLLERFEQVRQDLAFPHERTGRIHDEYRAIVDYLRQCSPADARLFVMSLSPEVYFYTARGVASGQVALTPGYYVTPRHAALMVDRLSRQDVPFVLVDAEISDELAVHYPRVVAYVQMRYREVALMPIGTGKAFRMFAEVDRATHGTYGDRQLPCFVP